ncbi:icd [Symbiodinium natans]|uniref:Icd protein n=1 Tax=Symbiodinium natans TaxID=878477 RepID=A0A812IJX0_9DINO|nr:icd [Symbiodinium natans]
MILDFFYVFFTGPSGITLNGTFGGNAGKFAPPGTAIVSQGLYVHRGLGIIDGLKPNAEDVESIYYADCPFSNINYPNYPSYPNPNPLGGSGSATVSYANCVVGNQILGRGRATGTTIADNSGESTTYVIQNAVFFDDEWPDAPTSSGRVTPLVSQPTFHREFQTDIVVFADGVLPVSRSRSGADILPYLFAHHYTHEAGIKFLRRWTSFKLDSEIRALRRKFLVALRDTFGIGLVQPDDWNDTPLHAQIDLGRGNTVVPYEVNHLSNQRALLKVLPDNNVEQPGLDSRLHEGGFRLLVGNSGIDTSAQHLPFGSFILQGVYVIENGSTGNIEISFRSKFPMITDPWSTVTAVQELHNPALGDGEARITIAEPSPTPMGQKINIRGNFGFRGP